jgi:hypothetical protein
MNNILILPPENIGKNFIPPEYLPKGKDEYYQREKQTRPPRSGWRHLRSDEVTCLKKNGNTSDNWDEILVADPFDTDQVKNTRFFGRVRIGRLRNVILQHHDLRIPAGITDSVIISCDIGDDVAIHNVHYLSHFILGDCCILFNIDEMQTTNCAKFGNGIIKEGEPESERIWLDLMNETGCRRVLPFDGMIPADAYLWSKYIDDAALQVRLKKITQLSFDNRHGLYGTAGNYTVIKNSLTLKDVKIGSHCYIKGAHKLKNLTINSSAEEPTQIGEGVELVNGIIGYGCQIFYGCMATKFILGNNSSLKYGARLMNTFLGDNSAIACCEVQNNLIFPAHEQHHNNSFLIASVVMGQSNIAAGATIGSNHNSRANDSEIQAGRGFWPGLCTSVKHSSRFASFTLLSKADYPAELDIPLPFSLLNNNVFENQLEVMPAFWWLYNMYALARNSWKFQNRDKRINKIQNIEHETFAPDTIEEVIHARRLLEIWTAKASLRQNKKQERHYNENMLMTLGKEMLSGTEEAVSHLEVLGEHMENAKRKTVIHKTFRAYHAYGDMLLHYAIKNVLVYLDSHPGATLSSLHADLKGRRQKEWVDLGGQIMQKKDLDRLRSDINSGKLKSWKNIHDSYNKLWKKYPCDKQKHAWAILCELAGTDGLSVKQWNSFLDKAMQIQEFIRDHVIDSRKKDYDNPFRLVTFRNPAEMKAAFGTLDENSFIVLIKKETEAYKKRISALKKIRK